MNETTDRILLSDWYLTDSKKNTSVSVHGSVVGGYCIKILEEKHRLSSGE